MNDRVGIAVAMMLLVVIFIPNINKSPQNYVIKESKIILLIKMIEGLSYIN